jgi:hypothetical protein
MATRKNIERRLKKFGKGLDSTSLSEKIESGKRWRVFNRAADGIHGYAGGLFFRDLKEVDDWLSLKEQDAE